MSLLQQVPLLQGLSRTCIQAIAEHAHRVTFLPGDVVIGESQKGEALYIITQGSMEVPRRSAGLMVIFLRRPDCWAFP